MQRHGNAPTGIKNIHESCTRKGPRLHVRMLSFSSLDAYFLEIQRMTSIFPDPRRPLAHLCQRSSSWQVMAPGRSAPAALLCLPGHRCPLSPSFPTPLITLWPFIHFPLPTLLPALPLAFLSNPLSLSLLSAATLCSSLLSPPCSYLLSLFPFLASLLFNAPPHSSLLAPPLSLLRPPLSPSFVSAAPPLLPPLCCPVSPFFATPFAPLPPRLGLRTCE